MNRNVILLCVILVCGVALQFSDPDYGAFKRDYFEAHLLGMEHLGQIEVFFDQLTTIPNSASGVIPLTIMGLLDDYAQRYIMNIVVLLATLIVLFKKSRTENFLLFLTFITLSPTFMSSLKWLLPEVMSICFILLLFSLNNKYNIIKYLMSMFVPLFRQTFIVFLALQVLLEVGKKIKDRFNEKPNEIFALKFELSEYREPLIQLAFGAIGLGFLYYFWGGLVPPRLAAVHNTFSVKASLNAFLIFGLYFGLFCVRSFFTHSSQYSGPKLTFCVLGASLFCLAFFNSEALEGGGYVFSRFELMAPILFYVFLFIYVSILLYFLPIPILITLIYFSFSFITTNHMYIKYVDQYMILLFGYFIVSPQVTVRVFPNATITWMMYSFVAFQSTSLVLAHNYYG